ncbi:ABC transporter permease, partial [Klebsiella pneumoniae]|nr:ABC transporter permease [Klebsiella pneumoniae]
NSVIDRLASVLSVFGVSVPHYWLGMLLVILYSVKFALLPATGASALTIIRVQVLGNVLGPIFVFSTGLISVCMILASGLSF